MLIKIKNKIFILVPFIGLFGCSQRQTKVDILIQKKIIGSWNTEYYKDSWRETALIFTFQDSTCSYLDSWGEYSKYWFNGDTLNIKERIRKKRGNISGGKLTYKFLVDSLTSENLFIQPITDETKELFHYRKEDNLAKIRLSKIKEQYDWKIERIGFYSTGCYGSCPSMYLEIDSIGNLLFNGKNYTDKEGLYSGMLSKKNLDIIKSEINTVQLDSLEKMYAANWTDDQTCGIAIKTNKKTYESSAYGFDKEPIALRILFHRLMELYKSVELKKDSTVADKFKFKQFKYRGYPPPPPMLSQ